ncbi:Acyl-CoA-binding protein [Burkholderiales bacterium]|nr:Acyl-CoA-binding protein [Burkholderiales bacterium]
MPTNDATLQSEFDQAVARSKTLKQRPDNASLLKLYALYKQATEGDVAGARPGAIDFVGLAKWKAREELLGVSATQAMRRYVALVAELED